MPLKIVEGDLFDNEYNLQAIGHGVNCMGSMGAGIAAQFAQRYPEMEKDYRILCQRGGLSLASMFVWETTNPIVYNLATQFWAGSDARIYAINTSVYLMLKDAEARSLQRIGIPRIGTGIGGLDVTTVESCLRVICSATKIDVYLFDYKPAVQPELTAPQEEQK